MTRWFVSLCLQRVILPLALVAGVTLRQNGLSGIYLFFLLWIPFIPVPTSKSMAGISGHFQKAVVALTSINIIATIAFQLVLAFGFPPYGSLLEPRCEMLERILRHVGLMRLDNLDFIEYIKLLGPDVVVLVTSIVVHTISSKLNPNNLLTDEMLPVSEPPHHNEESASSNDNSASQRRITILTMFGKYICLMMMCLAGILRPSILSGVYYLSFLMLATSWACNMQLGKFFAWYCRLLMVFLMGHIIALYLYQMEWIQELIPPDSPIPRFLGLTALLITDCNQDPRVTHMNTLEWASFANPFILLLLYYLLCFESDAIINAPVLLMKETGITRQLSTRLSQKGKLLRNQTNRWRSATRKVREPGNILDPRQNNEVLTESTPLIRGRESLYRRTPPRRGVLQDSRGSGATLTEVSDDLKAPEESTGMLDVIINAGLTIAQLLAQSSYIATNVIMMTWSIAYHSWLTFVLLLWASIMWLMPNQRKAMLRSSPFLVLYAIFLLLAQYIYGMDLTEQELPQTIQGLNLKQIGFEKITHLPVKPLLIKTLFTLMFWITLKQYVIEKREARNQSAFADIAAPLQIGVGTATGLGDESQTKTSQLIKSIGEFCRALLTKFWIWVVASVLFTFGIVGERMTIFRIVYMALALLFILTFQISWTLWRKLMYGFWLILIIYSMLILVMTYTYQFDHFGEYWERYLHIDEKLQRDIGLERYETTDLFFKLFIPTFFVIITVIQLYYFHEDFLAISDIKSRGTSSVRRIRISSTSDGTQRIPEQAGETVPEGVSPPIHKKRMHFSIRKALREMTLKSITHTFFKMYSNFLEFTYLALELHIIKAVMLTVMLVAIYNVCALHMLFVVMTVASLMFGSNIQIIVAHSMSFFASIVLLAKMIYQIEYIEHGKFNVSCENDNRTYNTAKWVGFEKTGSDSSLVSLLSGYIAIILIVTFHAVVLTRQNYQRHLKGRSLIRPLIIFPGITFVHAEKNLLSCVKYLINYVFYRFGIELCLIAAVILIGTRMDIYACIYAVWIFLLITPRRSVLSVLWPILTIFIAVSIPFQYSLVVGLPPFLCIGFPWEFLEEIFFRILHSLSRGWLLYGKSGVRYPWAEKSARMNSFREWFYLPDNFDPPPSYKIICDFLVFMLVCRQGVVFRIERKHIDGSYPGGTNRSIVDDAELDQFVNPTPDFISYTRSYLDVVKRILFQAFLWITLAVVFLAGTNRVNLFSLGYLIGAFIFLWQGNDLYLRPVKTILKWWNWLIIFNVAVIFIKTVLQMLGCLFIQYLKDNACWIVQLLGIACIKKFGSQTPIPRGAFDPIECEVYQGDIGLFWDSLCFTFLILQRRLFNSYYFFHIIDEAKAMSILASRGAELIEELSQKRIFEQQETEKRILEKIKNKMDRIKASQKKLQGPTYKEPTNHFQVKGDAVDDSTGLRYIPPRYRNIKAIRSGDYYMFDDFEEELDVISESESSSEDSDVQVDKERQSIGKFLRDFMKTDMDTAADKALLTDENARRRSGRRSSVPLPPSSAKPLKKSVSSLPDSPHKLSKIMEAREPKPGPSREEDQTDKSEEDKKKIQFGDGDDGSEEDDLSSISDEPLPPSLKSKFISLIKFIIAFINSIMVTITVYLNKFSRDYRFVMKTLTIEKKQLKSTKNFGSGIRRGSNRMWEPLPRSITLKSKSSPMSMQAFEEVDELDKKTQPPIVRLIMAIWYVILSHSELVCYFIIFLHQIRSPTILSLPLPLMIFLWGTLTVPRPSKTFWVTIIAYTEIVVIIKCMFQFEMIPWNSKLIPDNAPFALPRILGIERQPGTYAYYDLLLLLVVFFHRLMLKSLGLWKVSTYSTGPNSSLNSEASVLESYKTDEGTMHNGAKNMDKPDDMEDTTVALVADGDAASPFEHHRSSKMQLKTRKALWPFIKSFVILLKPTGKVTDDVYAYMFFCDFFNFLVVIFGFASFGSSQGDGGVSQYFEENKVPIPFLVMLILQFALIIIDRTLYLRKFILGKIIFQFILVIGIHAWMFFALPAVTQRNFNAAIPPQMWYMVKCLYLLLSAYQIRVGYPTRILGNFLCKSYNYINMFLFKVFMMVPFVFELRALMDWIWTDTSMTLSDWLKMEDIFAHVFQLKCQRRAENEYPQPRGEKKANIVKYFMGGGCLMGIIAVIWFPLVLFALGNTVGEPNLPSEMTAYLEIGSFLPVYKYTVRNNSIDSITAHDWEIFSNAYQKSRSAQTFLSNYEYEDVGVISFATNSGSQWSISPPVIELLRKELASNEPVLIRFGWVIHRVTSNPEEPPKAENSITSWLMPNDPVRVSLAKVFEEGSTTEEKIPLRNMMPKFLKVTSRGTATPIDNLMVYDDESHSTQLLRNVSIKPVHSPTVPWFWDLYEQCDDTTYENLLKYLPRNDCENKVVMYTFNDKAFPATLNLISGKGMIGIYILIFTVIAGVLRRIWFRVSQEIQFIDWPQADYVELICKSIYLAREEKNYDLEEYLYAKLIFIYRSPETMIEVTRITQLEHFPSDFLYDDSLPENGTEGVVSSDDSRPTTHSPGGARSDTGGGSRTRAPGGPRSDYGGGSRTRAPGSPRSNTGGGSRTHGSGRTRSDTSTGSRTHAPGGSSPGR
nr:piezo-type mechanosensitive ion channel component isoform X3 [Halyomorpha halys]